MVVLSCLAWVYECKHFLDQKIAFVFLHEIKFELLLPCEMILQKLLVLRRVGVVVIPVWLFGFILLSQVNLCFEHILVSMLNLLELIRYLLQPARSSCELTVWWSTSWVLVDDAFTDVFHWRFWSSWSPEYMYIFSFKFLYSIWWIWGTRHWCGRVDSIDW